MTLIFSEAWILRRRERDAEHRLDEHAEAAGPCSQALRAPRRIAVDRPEAEPLEQRARAVGEVEAGLASRPSRCSSGASFSSALSPIFGIDAWPATPSVRAEAEDALLGDADVVDAPAVERDDRARRPR